MPDPNKSDPNKPDPLQILLRQASVNGARVDVGIADGQVALVEPHIDTPAERVIDLDGRLLVPAFVESHIHLDKAYVADRSPGFRAAPNLPRCWSPR